MDTNTALLGTGTGGTILGIILLLYKTFNKKRLRSNCCGYKTEMSMDIDNVTPPTHQNPQSEPSFAVGNPLRTVPEIKV
jgi:hypothetical protein